MQFGFNLITDVIFGLKKVTQIIIIYRYRKPKRQNRVGNNYIPTRRRGLTEMTKKSATH